MRNQRYDVPPLDPLLAFEAAARNLSFTKAATYTALKSVLSYDVPCNAGFYRPIEVIAPPGTLVNPARPAATRARTSTCYKIFDAVNYALAPVLPEKVIAPGFDCQTGVSLARRVGGTFSVASEVLGAGVGALHDRTGQVELPQCVGDHVQVAVEPGHAAVEVAEELVDPLRCVPLRVHRHEHDVEVADVGEQARHHEQVPRVDFGRNPS